MEQHIPYSVCIYELVPKSGSTWTKQFLDEVFCDIQNNRGQGRDK